MADGEPDSPNVVGGGGIDIAKGATPLPEATLFLTTSLSFCLYASSRLISSSMRLANRYRRIHFPRFTYHLLAACPVQTVDGLYVLLWSSRKSIGSSSFNSSAYISASKQLNGSKTTVRFPELVSIEHQGATASKVLTSGSTSSKCLLPKLLIGLHYLMG